jgi:hypothetical protein
MRKLENILESELRAWLKSSWNKKGLGLQWIEPAKGSSVGFPDVLIPVSGNLIPFELKACKRDATKKDNLVLNDTNEGYAFSCEVRPAQKRFHLLAQSENIFSGYLIACGSKTSFDVWLSTNRFRPWNRNNFPGEIKIATNQTRKSSLNRDVFLDYLVEMIENY